MLRRSCLVDGHAAGDERVLPRTIDGQAETKPKIYPLIRQPIVWDLFDEQPIVFGAISDTRPDDLPTLSRERKESRRDLDAQRM